MAFIRFLLLLPVLWLAACAGDETCSSDTDCGADRSCCGGVCLNLQADVQNCGVCGRVCSEENGTASCENAECKIACAQGFGDCNDSVRDGCETEVAASAEHCGGCGQSCSFKGASGVCEAGVCRFGGCSQGFADCDGAPENGCETDLQSTVKSCGACGQACQPAQAKGRCAAGRCFVQSCNPGYADCNKTPDDGCEAFLAGDAAHCGACGDVCGAAETCFQGECRARTALGFGGLANFSAVPLAELWRFDFATQAFESLATQTPDGSPGARAGHVAVWDASATRMLVWGGFDDQDGAPMDLWALDFLTTPPTWQRLETKGTPPSGRASFASGWDAKTRRLYLQGGSGLDGDAGDFFVLDVPSLTWSEPAAMGEGPGVRSGVAGAFDAEARRFYVFGGFDADFSTVKTDTFSFDVGTSTWSTVPGDSPGGQLIGAFFAGSQPPAHFGGVVNFDNGGEHNDEVWTLGGTPAAWKKETDVPSGQAPQGRWTHAAVAAGKLRLVYGGEDYLSGIPHDEVWLHDAGASPKWTRLVSSGTPVGRVLSSVVLP